jgi:hypothetical protein
MDNTKSPLDYQLDFLKLEVETINRSISQCDEIIKNIKQWAITLWTASVGGALAKPELTKYIILTAIVPLLFWYVDALYRSTERRFIFRTLMIKDFLNGKDLQRSIDAGKLEGFEVMNPAARSNTGQPLPGLKEFTNTARAMRFQTTSALYSGLALLSITLWLVGIGFGFIHLN